MREGKSREGKWSEAKCEKWIDKRGEQRWRMPVRGGRVQRALGEKDAAVSVSNL